MTEINNQFSTGEAIKFGFDTWKDNKVFFLKLILVYFLISITAFSSLFVLEKLIDSALFTTFSTLFSNVLTIFLQLGLIRICLNFYEEKRVGILELFSQKAVLLSTILALILYLIFISIGLILFIIPGIYFGLRLWFYDFFIVDKKNGAFESLKNSWEKTKGNVLKIICLLFLLTIINILGFLFFIVGLFITIPISYLAISYAYKEMAKE